VIQIRYNQDGKGMVLDLIGSSNCTSGKSVFFLSSLEHAYHDLMMVSSIAKLELAKPGCSWAKPGHTMNLT